MQIEKLYTGDGSSFFLKMYFKIKQKRATFSDRPFCIEISILAD
jgi:hypothetical protein